MHRSESKSDAGRSASPGDGGSAAFADQFKASYRALAVLAAGIVGNRSLAEDVVQEAALIALDKLDQFQPGTNFGAWMSQMVRYVALNQSRKERRRRSQGLDGAMEQGQRVSGGEYQTDVAQIARGVIPADHGQFDDALTAALGAVGAVPRACLLLRTLEGLSYAEIARMLDIPEGTAMSHVHRTRRFLRERLANPDQPIRADAGDPS